MDTSTTRPKVAQLMFRLLSRSIHPELFQSRKSHRIYRDAYQAFLSINTDGHVISVRTPQVTLTEVTSSSLQVLPPTHHVLEHPVYDTIADELVVDQAVRYRYRCSLERVSAKVFWMIQNQLKGAGSDHDLVYFFNASGRIPIGGMSYIHIDSRCQRILFQAIHTFPDDLALLKSESCFTIL